LSPASAAQQYLIVWFERYFVKFGDKAANHDETNLIIMAKRNVYQKYTKEMSKINETVVTISTFTNIWNTIFPRYTNRPWCDVPGKTNTFVVIVVSVVVAVVVF
jgi:hypothetical protein